MFPDKGQSKSYQYRRSRTVIVFGEDPLRPECYLGLNLCMEYMALGLIGDDHEIC